MPALDAPRRARAPRASQDYWDEDAGQPPVPGPGGPARDGDPRWPGQEEPSWGQPPPSWGNEVPSGGAGWGQPPEWADESLGADDSHWAQPAAGTPPPGDPYWNQPGAPPADDGAQWGGPPGPGAPPPWGVGRHWAQPSGTGAPPPDDDPYWGQPPPWPGQDQPEDWAAGGPEARPWSPGGAVPVPPGPGEPAARTTMLPGHGMPAAGPRAPRRGRRIWMPIVALVAGLAVSAGILLATKHKPGNASAGSNPTAGGTSTPAAKLGPVSVANIFPQTQLNIDGLRFTRVAATMARNCASAANGAFASALASAGCKRVVRATYVDSHKQYVVTAGVAAMPTRADAKKADAVKKFGPDLWFTALDGPANSGASAASKTVGVGSDVVDNRFIVFALSSYSNGQNPTGHPSDIQTLTELSQAFTNQVEQQLAGRVKS